MSDWLERLRGLVRTHERAPDTEQSRRVARTLGERVVFATEAAWLDAVGVAIDERSESDGVGALPASPVGRGRSPLGIAGGGLDGRTLEHLVGALKVPGFYGELADEEAAAHLGFWRRLAERAPGDPVVQAHFADVEMTLGDAGDGVRRFIDAFDRQPELFLEFGWDLEDDVRAVGGGALFAWQLHLLRWFLRAPAEHVESGDEARELYGELLEEYRDDPVRLAALHPLGEEIRRLEVAGDLPRAMVVRRRRRPKNDAEG